MLCINTPPPILAKGHEPEFIKASGSTVNLQEIQRTDKHVITVLSVR